MTFSCDGIFSEFSKFRLFFMLSRKIHLKKEDAKTEKTEKTEKREKQRNTIKQRKQRKHENT